MPTPNAVDMKYYGTVRKRSDSTPVPPDEMIVFRAKDNAVPAMLAAYLVECSRLGCGAAQLAVVGDLIERVEVWRSQNPDKCKKPD